MKEAQICTHFDRTKTVHSNQTIRKSVLSITTGIVCALSSDKHFKDITADFFFVTWMGAINCINRYMYTTVSTIYWYKPCSSTNSWWFHRLVYVYLKPIYYQTVRAVNHRKYYKSFFYYTFLPFRNYPYVAGFLFKYIQVYIGFA